MFLAALFIIGKVWKQPSYSSTDEWIKKMWYIYTHTHIYMKEHIRLVGEKGGHNGIT